VSGLTPPITAATTITQVITTNGAAETVAVAVAVGAGVVGAGALAAWLFTPVPNAPPAPTTPPSYPTSSQDPPTDTDTEDSDTNTDTANPTTISEPPAACPFTPVNPTSDFKAYTIDPTWTGAIPTLTTSSVAHECTSTGSNGQLLRGTDPGYVKALAAVFCKSDLSKDEDSTLGIDDLPDGNSWKNPQLSGVNIKFDFKFGSKHDDCPQNCVDTFTSMVLSCEYIHSHFNFSLLSTTNHD
jgi:hypothetical protein